LRHLRLHIETNLHQSYEGIAGSGYEGRDFHRTSLTCPQIKPAHGIAQVSFPSKRSKIRVHEMPGRGLRIAQLAQKKVRHRHN
jgi:hypothetical protein